MAIGRESLSARLLPIVIQVLFAEAAFEVGPRIHARRRVRLEIDQIVGAEEMIEADFEQIGRRGVARDVAAELGMGAVGAHHHGERVPAHHGRNAGLELEVAGKLLLVGERDRVLVGGIQDGRQRHAPRARVIEEFPQEKSRALAAFGFHQRVERVQPLAGLGRIGVRRIHAPECRSYDVGEVRHAPDGSPANRENC